ncbi:MAG: SDR family oxidoreductase [Deltaproteobacteria bacterium]|nr:SDR family oxidoreductase [Deltaproteobacteria bacterium]
MSEPGTLAGRVCVLAGGSGGIGGTLARALHAEGAPLVIGYRRARERAEALAADLRAAGAAAVATVGGDLSEEATRDALLAAARGLGDPYGLVVLAGDPARPLDAVATQAEIESSLRDNYVGPMLLARSFSTACARGAGGGAIVLFSTMQGVALFEGSLGYASPKAALIHGARLLAKEVGGPADVRVNVVAPGVTAAGMAEASIRSGKYDRFVSGGAIRRFGRPEDVVRAVRFFLEPDGYVTGQVLTVDGGLTLRRDVLGR